MSIPEKMREALERICFTDEKLEKYDGSSLIVQDLGIWGDDFDEFYEILCEIYGTTPVIEERFIPSEFSWMKSISGWNIFRSPKKVQKSEPLSINELHKIMVGEAP